jgi:hypothetical protein
MLGKREIEAKFYDHPVPALRGWYWRCACVNCEDQGEWYLYGPFETERLARCGLTEAPYEITLDVINRTGREVDLRCMTITANMED